MSDSSINITAGSGTAIDTRTEGTNSNHRQVIVIGDPATNAGVAPVDATKGLAVDLTATGANTTAIKVDGSAVTQPVSGTVTATIAAGATTIAKAEDAASASADTGVPAMAIQKATPGNLAGADGDYEMLQMSAGRLWTSATIDAALPAGTNGIGKLTANAGVTIGAVELAAAQTLATVTTVSTLTGGGVAHDSADSGNPVKIGAKVETSPKGITVAADGDRTDMYADADGLLMVKIGHSNADLVSERVSDTAGTSAAFTNFSAVASTYNYVTAISVHNAHASTNAYVDFRDGTAGSVLYTLALPANGGAIISAGGSPLFRTSANTALAYDVSAAVTTVYISVSGYQSKV